MGYFWAVFVSIVLILILGGIVGSNIKQRRIRKAREKLLPNVTDHIQVEPSLQHLPQSWENAAKRQGYRDFALV